MDEAVLHRMLPETVVLSTVTSEQVVWRLDNGDYQYGTAVLEPRGLWLMPTPHNSVHPPPPMDISSTASKDPKSLTLSFRDVSTTPAVDSHVTIFSGPTPHAKEILFTIHRHRRPLNDFGELRVYTYAGDTDFVASVVESWRCLHIRRMLALPLDMVMPLPTSAAHHDSRIKHQDDTLQSLEDTMVVCMDAIKKAYEPLMAVLNPAPAVTSPRSPLSSGASSTGFGTPQTHKTLTLQATRPQGATGIHASQSAFTVESPSFRPGASSSESSSPPRVRPRRTAGEVINSTPAQTHSMEIAAKLHSIIAMTPGRKSSGLASSGSKSVEDIYRPSATASVSLQSAQTAEDLIDEVELASSAVRRTCTAMDEVATALLQDRELRGRVVQDEALQLAVESICSIANELGRLQTSGDAFTIMDDGALCHSVKSSAWRAMTPITNCLVSAMLSAVRGFVLLVQAALFDCHHTMTRSSNLFISPDNAGRITSALVRIMSCAYVEENNEAVDTSKDPVTEILSRTMTREGRAKDGLIAVYRDTFDTHPFELERLPESGEQEVKADAKVYPWHFSSKDVPDYDPTELSAREASTSSNRRSSLTSLTASLPETSKLRRLSVDMGAMAQLQVRSEQSAEVAKTELADVVVMTLLEVEDAYMFFRKRATTASELPMSSYEPWVAHLHEQSHGQALVFFLVARIRAELHVALMAKAAWDERQPSNLSRPIHKEAGAIGLGYSVPYTDTYISSTPISSESDAVTAGAAPPLRRFNTDKYGLQIEQSGDEVPITNDSTHTAPPTGELYEEQYRDAIYAVRLYAMSQLLLRLIRASVELRALLRESKGHALRSYLRMPQIRTGACFHLDEAIFDAAHRALLGIASYIS